MNSLSKWSATCRPQTGRSACTSAKRNGAHSTDHSESGHAFDRGFVCGVAFAFATVLLLNLWLGAA